MDPLDDLPKRSQTHDIQAAAESAFKAQIKEAGIFVLQAEDQADYGTDFHIEARNGSSMTNFRVHVQLKGTTSDLNSDNSISVSLGRKNLNYLLAQPESIYVCHHVDRNSLWVRYADDVFREYEHRNIDWQSQTNITVKFTQPFDKPFQQELHRRALAIGRDSRSERLHWARTPPEKYAAEVRKAIPSIVVPHDRTKAKKILANLFADCEDATISKAFFKFEALLSEKEGEMDEAYMAEINLGINDFPFDLERVAKGIDILRCGLSRKKAHPGSIHYCIGNGFLALGEFAKALDAYSMALALLTEHKVSAVAAQCIKNKGAAHEGAGEYEQARTCYEEALKREPNLFQAHLALALWHRKHSRDIPLAIHHLDQAVPDSVPLQLTLAPQGWKIEMHFLLGKSELAFADVNRLLPFSRDINWILPWCASLISKFGRTSCESAGAALQFWNYYLKQQPEDKLAQRERFMCFSFLHARGANVDVGLKTFRQLAAGSWQLVS